MIMASRAFRPFHGSAAAWDCSPVKTTSTSSDASGWLSTWFRSHGWYRRAASTPANRPSSIMICLPLPRSSAGVPRNTISPGRSSATAARAIAAPTPDAAIVLWPQPWPRPGSASYSARIPMRGPSPRPPGSVARTAVARLPAGCWTSNPCSRRTSATQVAAWCSSKAGSGLAWMRCERSMISSRAPSTAAATRALRSTCGSAGRTAVRSGTDPPGRWVGAARPGPPADGSVARRNRCQRSAESVASATDASARMNRAIGSSSAPCSRSTMKIATISPTQPPRRAARVQSPW